MEQTADRERRHLVAVDLQLSARWSSDELRWPVTSRTKSRMPAPIVTSAAASPDTISTPPQENRTV
ncbi:MAG: hypothetical protein ABI873_11725 [Marmoricola sp.]